VAVESLLRTLLDDVADLEASHRAIVGSVQQSKARAATVEATLQAIAKLPVMQQELLTEAAEATRAGLYRSACVSAFAALADSLHERIGRKGALPTIAAARKWTLTSVEDLREYADHNVADAAKEALVISKAQMKSFHGLLHRRNQAAHPSGAKPTVDEALGYISECVRLMAAFQT
jgi:hypothetical protein